MNDRKSTDAKSSKVVIVGKYKSLVAFALLLCVAGVYLMVKGISISWGGTIMLGAVVFIIQSLKSLKMCYGPCPGCGTMLSVTPAVTEMVCPKCVTRIVFQDMKFIARNERYVKNNI